MTNEVQRVHQQASQEVERVSTLANAEVERLNALVSHSDEQIADLSQKLVEQQRMLQVAEQQAQQLVNHGATYKS